MTPFALYLELRRSGWTRDEIQSIRPQAENMGMHDRLMFWFRLNGWIS